LVPFDSRLKAIVDVDSEGIRIAVTARSAYGLWLDRNIKHAELIRSDTLDSAYEEFVNAKLSALTASGRDFCRIWENDAIRAVTIDAARRIGQGDRLGSLEKDKEADFTILESDPFVALGIGTAAEFSLRIFNRGIMLGRRQRSAASRRRGQSRTLDNFSPE
jgi:hypothetical protein